MGQLIDVLMHRETDAKHMMNGLTDSSAKRKVIEGYGKAEFTAGRSE